MKKWFIVLFLIVTILPFQATIMADTYSPHYLPGGKNYLSNDNFVYQTEVLSSISPFAVKPHTYYTISFPRDFYDPGEIHWQFTFYENDYDFETFSYDNTNLFIHSSEPYYGSFTFQMPANANYLALSIADNNDYLKDHLLGTIILEEGENFTSYEEFVIGNLIDINGPYFQGNGTIIVNVDSPYTLTEITSGISAYDAIEGDVSNRIQVVSDAYTANRETVGEYPVSYSVSDLSGNITTFSITVKVVDITKPVITGTNRVVLSYPNTLTIEDIRKQLNASDNVDGDISEQIVLVEENYLANSSALGFYEAVFKVTDSSNNTSFITVEIEVIDENSPLISGPSSFVIGYNAILTLHEIINSQSVIDDYDSDLSNRLSVKTDLYTANMKKIGTYPIVLTVSDSSGNISEKTISVQVTDVIGPVVYLDTSVIMVYNDTIYGLSDFTTLLINTGELEGGIDYQVNVLFDSYTSRSTQKGVYHIVLEYKNSLGESALTKTLEIVVKEKSADYYHDFPDIQYNDELPEQKFIQRYWLYLAVGGILLITVVSNVIWFVLYKRR